MGRQQLREMQAPLVGVIREAGEQAFWAGPVRRGCGDVQQAPLRWSRQWQAPLWGCTGALWSLGSMCVVVDCGFVGG